ncbi:14612_t:CDS:10 [Acaulospora morrowiae]|uniref:14612_t:CDS:1 n=1 Tax=Acaulospora morrowiae TaxID=94023 RepID=A0A9N9DFY8_9GLOM|nr:14612_t:CDS:10 [Acaulospora morrowiae]
MATERKILLLGSGFVAGPAVGYLLRRPENHLTIACRRISHAEALANLFPRTTPIALDVNDKQALDEAVSKHDLVISLIPYTHHPLVIESAIKFKKNVVTTSYVSPAMKEFDQAAKENGVTILNEVGLDPGIDHLYAVKTIKEVHSNGGKIVSFISYCGGLPAPEASNNPLGYKFSWSSRGIVEIPGHQLMQVAKPYAIYPAFAFLAYPNRDSTPFREFYNIPEAQTIIRGTLRYQGFTNFVKVLVDIGLLSSSEQEYLSPDATDIKWRDVLARVLGVTDNSESNLRAHITSRISGISEEDMDRILRGFKWIGLFSDNNVERRGTLLDTLCATLEEKMQYAEGERDMVLLQHKFEVETKDGKREMWTSTLLEYGKPPGPSAMATTVGTPCGIAAQLVLDGVINKRGVLAPYTLEIINPIIESLEKEGIKVIEEKMEY